MNIAGKGAAVACYSIAVSFIFHQARITDSQLSKLTTGNTKKYTDANNNYFYNYTREVAGDIGALSMLQSLQTT